MGKKLRRIFLDPDAKATRTFGGIKYYLFVSAESKREALREATRLRANGYRARIFSGKDNFFVYANPKPPRFGALLLRRRK